MRRTLSVVLLLFVSVATAQTVDEAPAAVHVLDYIGVDYPQVVKDGKVASASEHAEQVEFARKSAGTVERLPPVAAKAEVLAKAQTLVGRIEAKAPGAEIATLARALAADVSMVRDSRASLLAGPGARTALVRIPMRGLPRCFGAATALPHAR